MQGHGCTTIKKFFTEEQKKNLDPTLIPQHIAIIPDGNRRWANQRAQGHSEGHQSGANGLLDIVRSAKELGVKVLTVYTFSTENWKRDASEIDALMWLIESYLKEECAEMKREGLKLETIGVLDPLPESLKETIKDVKAQTAECEDITLVLALNYGSRNEITRAVRQIVDDYASGKVERSDITESYFATKLDTARWPDPDLFIRTSDEMRISNYLLWQLSYAEIYVCPVLWPDFQPQDLYDAVKTYQKRNRRLGS